MDAEAEKDALEAIKKLTGPEGWRKLMELEASLTALQRANSNLKIENQALRQRIELLEEARSANKPARHMPADKHARTQ